MVKYKNLKPEIIQEFIDKIFTSVVTKYCNKTTKDLAKKRQNNLQELRCTSKIKS